MDPRENIFAGDVSNEVRPRYGHMAGSPKALVIHHTGGEGNVHGVTSTFNQRGFPAHFVIDRDGQIYKTLPDGERGAHIRPSSNSHLSNADTVGVEIIGKDDRDITPQQIDAARRLHGHLSQQFPGLQVYGHGEINAHKQIDEGRTVAMALRNGRESGLPKIAGDTRVMPASMDPKDRTLMAYQAAQQGVTVDQKRAAEQPFKVAGPIPARADAAPAPVQTSSLMQRRDYLGAPPAAQPSPAPYRSPAPAPVSLAPPGSGRNAIMERGGSGMPAQGDVERYIADAARQRGIDPNIATQVYRSEGAAGYRGDRGSSFGPYQLHYGGIAGAGRGMQGKGLGDEFTRVTGLDARNPETWQKQVDFSLDRAKKDGWGAWHGWKGDPRAGLNGPAPVATPPARPEDLRNPNLEKNMGGSQIASNAPLPPQRPATTLLDHLNPVSSANAAPLPPSATLPRIRPEDPSGSLLPQRDVPVQAPTAAPVQAPAATPAQLAQPQLSPLGTGSSFQDVAARLRGGGFNGYGPGITEQNDIRTAFGDNARKGDMPGDVPYAVNMAGSQEYLQHAQPPGAGVQLPPIDVGPVPQGPGNGYQPATPGYAPMTSDPSQYQPIQTPVSTPAVDPAAFPAPVPVDLPSSDPGPTFTPTDTSPAMGDSMPSVGGEGGGDMGGMFAGLADALGNLGGGGEGAGQQMPNPTSRGVDALQATASMPDFPHLGDQYASLLQQRGALADAPVGMPQAPGFSLKQIGQAGQQPDQSMEGFARPALKRLFTA